MGSETVTVTQTARAVSLLAYTRQLSAVSQPVTVTATLLTADVLENRANLQAPG